MKDNRVITTDHEVAQYIRGFKIHVNTPWEFVDYICIPINIPELCHWVLAVINIKSFCIHGYDSLFKVGSKHIVVVNYVIRKLAEIIPLFFISTDFYGKQSDINWEKKMESMDRALGAPLVYVIADDIPQQREDSKKLVEFVCYIYFTMIAAYTLVLLPNTIPKASWIFRLVS